MKYLKIVLFHLLFLLPIISMAQQGDSSWEPVQHPKYAFVHDGENTLSRSNKLDSFFYKLVQLKHTHKGKVSVIHIGDSHLQADGITSVVRNGLQQYFGDAGRGLVFPYQLASSNAPHDIKSSSNATWKSNRLTSPDKPIKTGISGYGIHSSNKNAFVNIQLKEIEGRQDSFDRMVFFLCNDSVCYKLTDSNIASFIPVNTSKTERNTAVAVNADKMLKGFELCKVGSPEACDYSFYGVSLEKKDNPGLLYHTIGVNGARYDQFLQNDLFWDQVKSLQGDLFIVSLGTNEAQNQYINEQAFVAACDSFIKMIRKIAPHACVLLTTPAGSFYKIKKPNKSIQTVATALNRFCDNTNIASWDLFNVTSGLPGTMAWKKYDLISHDGVHYNNAGYQLQGSLLLNAFIAGYNKYEKAHPYKPVVKVAPAQPKVSDIIVKADIGKKPQPAPAVAPLPKPQPLTPVVKKVEPANDDVTGQQKRKSNIVVEYSD